MHFAMSVECFLFLMPMLRLTVFSKWLRFPLLFQWGSFVLRGEVCWLQKHVWPWKFLEHQGLENLETCSSAWKKKQIKSCQHIQCVSCTLKLTHRLSPMLLIRTRFESTTPHPDRGTLPQCFWFQILLIRTRFELGSNQQHGCKEKGVKLRDIPTQCQTLRPPQPVDTQEMKEMKTYLFHSQRSIKPFNSASWCRAEACLVKANSMPTFLTSLTSNINNITRWCTQRSSQMHVNSMPNLFNITTFQVQHQQHHKMMHPESISDSLHATAQVDAPDTKDNAPDTKDPSASTGSGAVKHGGLGAQACAGDISVAWRAGEGTKSTPGQDRAGDLQRVRLTS